MKVCLNEFNQCFTVELYPEDEKEVAALVRLGMNVVKGSACVSVSVHENLSVEGWIRFGKRKRPTNSINQK